MRARYLQPRRPGELGSRGEDDEGEECQGVIVEADGDPKVRAILVRITLRIQGMLAAQLGGDDAAERAGIILANLWGLGLYDFVLRPKRPGALAASYIASIAERAPAQHTRRTKR